MPSSFPPSGRMVAAGFITQRQEHPWKASVPLYLVLTLATEKGVALHFRTSDFVVC